MADETPPETERDPVVEELHGDRHEDPYRWLEASDERVEAWVDAQNDYADAHLERDPRGRPEGDRVSSERGGTTRASRDTLRPQFEALAAVTEYGPLVPRGDRRFGRVEAPDEDHAVLYTWTADAPEDRSVVVDPNRWGETAAMNWFVPSPDGDLVAYGYDEGGEEQYDVRVVDVGGNLVHELPDAGRVNPGTFAWTGDGFCYVTTGSADEGGQLDKEVRRRTLDGDDELLTDDVPTAVWPVLHVDDGTLVATFGELAGSADVYVERDGDLVPAIEGYDADFEVRVDDGTAYLRTDHGAPMGRVLACPVDELVDTPLAEMCELVSEGDRAMQTFDLAGDALVVHALEDACSRLAAFDRATGEYLGDLDVPALSAVDELAGNPDADEACYRVQGFDRPPAWVEGDARSGETRTLDAPDVEVPDLAVSREWVDSTDGARVPVFVVHHADVDPDEAPTVLYGYGGFRVPQPPGFDRFRLPFLRDGGVYAQVCARGGTEFGEEWHQDGRRDTKQHTFDDFVAAGEALVDRGVTTTERLAVTGGSNGGLSVGACVTQRPDLWGAAVCAVPLLDMLRFHRFLLGASWTVEYGDPDVADDYEYISEYTPYQHVEAREYPPVLFETAAGDTRVHPSHARKMTARMQHRAEGGPFLLRTNDDTGHGVGKPTSMVVEEQLDTWTFLYRELGVAQ